MNGVPWPLVNIYFKLLRVYQTLHNFFIPLFKKKNEQKVFCIGFPKTGTVSLTKALSILGYRSVHLLRAGFEPKEGWVNYIKKLNYDAYADAPVRYDEVYKKLDKIYPNSKFILTLRDKDSLEKSFINFYKGSPWAVKNSKDLKIRLQRYDILNRLAFEYFKDKPDELLVMNIFEGDGWDKLCKFLNKPIPNKPFPHKNVGRYRN
jgi:hypothetical protein